MSRTPITFTRACDIINAEIACIVDEDALSYPQLNEDFNGDDCIEVNWCEEDGMNENMFTARDSYFITDKGEMEIHKHSGMIYNLRFLKITKIKA